MGERGRKIADSTKAEIMADIALGHSNRRISETYQVNRDTVSRLASTMKRRTRELGAPTARMVSPSVATDVSAVLRAIGANCLTAMLSASHRLASTDLSEAGPMALRAYVSATRDLIETVKPFVMTAGAAGAEAGLAAGEGEPVESDGPGEGKGVGESS